MRVNNGGQRKNRPFRGLVVTFARSPALALNLAWALELGGIHTQSALDEPFAGRIELLGVTPDELDTIEVLLASKAEFDKADTPRPRFLTGLEFEPLTSPEGQTIIRIASRQPSASRSWTS